MTQTHTFLLQIEGDLTRKEAQKFIRDIGSHQSSLPIAKRITISVKAAPIGKPTLFIHRIGKCK